MIPTLAPYSHVEDRITMLIDCPLPLDIPCINFNDIKGIADVIEERVILIQGSGNSIPQDQHD
jgi:hypothetical protein